MDQENSEEKTVSENDERDWMKAKKFWKPGRASVLDPILQLPDGLLLSQRSLVSKPGIQQWDEAECVSYPTPCHGKKSQGLPPCSYFSLCLLICQEL